MSSEPETKTVVATVGMFDGVHRGHQHLLNQASALAGRTLAVTFTDHPLRTIAPDRAPELLMPPEERLATLAALPAVDEVVALEFDEQLRLLTAAEFMAMLRERFGVTHLVLGYDNGFGHDRPKSPEHYIEAGRSVGVEVVPATPLIDEISGQPISSSAIRRALAAGDIEAANRMLGREFTLAGTVVSGRQDGRKLGSPTANLQHDPRLAVPARGVYACRATVDGTTFPAAVNIGVCPTLTGAETATVEAHLIGCDADLYTKPLSLSFVAHLRPERRFPSVDALKSAIASDISRTIDLIN